MRKTRILALAVLLSGMGSQAWAQDAAPDSSTSSSQPLVRIDAGEGDGSNNSINAESSVIGNEVNAADDVYVTTNSADATGGSASASDRSSAYVDNSVEIYLRDSSLTHNELKGEVSKNSVNIDGYFSGRNELKDRAFSDTKGVNQVAQNAGVNGLIQQVFSIGVDDVRIRLEERQERPPSSPSLQ